MARTNNDQLGGEKGIGQYIALCSFMNLKYRLLGYYKH
jgi:hypothetical protein